MTLGARLVFVTSLAANVAALYLLASVPAPAVDAPSMTLAARPPSRAAEVDRGDAHTYLETLLARGLSLEETKPLVLARLTAESARASDRDADEYWRPGYEAAAVARVSDRVAAEDRVRTTLRALYGPQARSDAAFHSVFEPLDERYAFLSAEQQLALQKLTLERLRAQADGARAALASRGVQGAAARRAPPTSEALEDLRASLGPEPALEYLYRFSPLAEQLRAADIGLSEAEFRSVFATLLRFEGAAADANAFAQTRAALRSALGDARFTRLWATRDPLFGAISDAGRQLGLAEGAIEAAYAILNDAQDRLAAVAGRFAAVDPARAAEEFHGIQRDTQERLASLVGQDAAEALVHASTRFAVAMQQASSTNLKE